MRDVPEAAGRQAGVFTTAQACDGGWTPSALRHGVRVDALWRPRPGTYAVPPPDDSRHAIAVLTQRSVAAALTNHGVRVSHLAAASLAHADVWAERPRACVTHSGPAVSTIPGVHPHRLLADGSDNATFGDDLLMTSPARTVVDIAREFGIEAGVVAADSVLRVPFGDRERLHRALARARGTPHVGWARQAVAHADARSESVLESRSRFRMAVAGLPSPQTQVDIHLLDGRWLGRADFYWPEFGVVGEADGLAKYDGFRALTAEKLREDAFRDVGLQLARWVWADLARFAVVVDRIQRAFARGETRVDRRRWRAIQRPTAELPPRMVV